MNEKNTKIGIVGLGYVGLALGISYLSEGFSVLAVEKSNRRILNITSGNFDGTEAEKSLISKSLDNTTLEITQNLENIQKVDCIFICLPTPTDDQHRPDYSILSEACEAITSLVQPGQTVILTSTSFVGTTRQLLVEPLEARGFEVGKDIFLAFSPERVDPGNLKYSNSQVNRVLSGATEACHQKAYSFLSPVINHLHKASSLEAAEMTKLMENSFRAVNIAWINEMADLAGKLNLNISELVELASTKPYGYMKFMPGSGAGGHCIPADPHYLLMDEGPKLAPITTLVMQQLHQRPVSIAKQAIEIIKLKTTASPSVLFWGITYKPNVSDLRGSPALIILNELIRVGINVEFHDPQVANIRSAGQEILNVTNPQFKKYDLIILHTIHNGGLPDELFDCGVTILDTTFKYPNMRGVILPA